jgi:hypothetical protein
VYYHNRDPDPLWQDKLERIAPRTDRANWLKVKWFPGMPYEPVQRWCVWEMIPILDHVDPEILSDLEGKSPRAEDNGEWDEDPSIDQQLKGPLIKKSPRGIVMRWVSWSNVCLEQWELFQETGCYSNRTWIIQGDKGGHLYRMSKAELGVLEANGITDADTPLPGDLPYAPFTDLTVTKLAEADWLRRYEEEQKKDWAARAGLSKSQAGVLFKQETVAREVEYNKRMLHWLEDQIEGAVDELPRAVLPQPSNHGTPVKVDEDAIDEEFIHDTPTRL